MPWSTPHVPVRVAWAPTLGYAEVDAEVLAACEKAVGVLESLGADVTTVDTVFEEDPVGDWLTLVGACHLRTMRPFFDHPRWDEVDPVLRAIVDGAKATTGEQVVQALDRCHTMNLALVDLFHEVRILITPDLLGRGAATRPDRRQPDQRRGHRTTGCSSPTPST